VAGEAARYAQGWQPLSSKATGVTVITPDRLSREGERAAEPTWEQIEQWCAEADALLGEE
jgi:hypothetical protein